MFNKKKSKKGISPLIATVLLIAFTIVLALLVWFWFSGFISEQTQKQGDIIEGQLSCSTGINLNIRKACYDSYNKVVRLTIDNGANNALSGFIIRISSSTESNVDVNEVPVGIEALNVKTIEAFPVRVSSPDKVIIIPRLNINSGVISCSEQAVEAFLDLGC